jgi:hypothetical protein
VAGRWAGVVVHQTSARTLNHVVTSEGTHCGSLMMMIVFTYNALIPDQGANSTPIAVHWKWNPLGIRQADADADIIECLNVTIM